ncbi:tRNA (guanosine(46)-N7)-methyltransferase TrmB [Buchnera aphidicola (Macrosiphoniella sanborni)]|uniref:tRNA (guanine-N(7)-)-methyltransferase n=1 Tax=Buchnera aphidicola (Macrosiphoniella sanborni) TaxID=1241865 RepID=A0A4D6Y6B8_9GAMM|nr:tRNA (guanosine(46)-N7)-methyltransferase TrmB [Buchnera aphidicola]QCI24053.1 tRNA (guanosine(46)-N7)-methyltransferase TrmB [Buchnera aphidicola (Macrosiphoniella sanborni)]
MRNNIFIPKYKKDGTFLRQIHSFIFRQRRLTTSQKNAIQKYWSCIGVNFQDQLLNLSSIFNSNYQIVLEIGFGCGKTLIQNAINFPKKNFLGIEVYKSGIGSCLNLAHIYQVKNLRIIYHDAVEVMKYMIPDNTLSIVQIFFPDPWNKKRHHKRRLVKKKFLEIIAKKLIINGILHVATDSKSYACYILNEIKDINEYQNLSKKNDFIPRPISRVMTKFEIKACIQGNSVFDLMFKLKNNISDLT